MDVAGGVVLAGGRSRRMGMAKAALEWHGSTLLYRAAAVLARSVAGPVVVVAAPGQALPALPAGVEVAADPVEGRGPMQGLAVGLAALAGRVGTAFVCSTDLPFLHPAFVHRVLRGFADGTGLATDVDVVLPVAHGFRQPLAAAYRTRIAGRVAELLARGMDKPGMLFEHCVVARLDDAALVADPALATHDPGLRSVLNVNTPNDYTRARDRPPPEVAVDGGGTVRAATVGAAAEATGRVVTAVNGQPVADPLFPLVAGDTITVGRPGARGNAAR